MASLSYDYEDVYAAIKGKFSGVKMRKPGEVQLRCPYHEDNTPSAFLLMHGDKQSFYCFSCKRSDSLVYFLYLHKINVQASFTKERLESRFKEIPVDGFVKKSAPERKRESIWDRAMDYRLDNRAIIYIQSRLGKNPTIKCGIKVTESDTLLFKGVHSVVVERMPKGYSTRFINHFDPDVFTHTKDCAGEPLVMVEGVFDYLNMVNLGFDKTLALLNGSLSDHKLRQVVEMNPPVVYMFLDNDFAGQTGSEKNALKLTRLGIKVMVVPYPEDMPEHIKDPGGMDRGMVYEALSQARPFLRYVTV